MACYLVRREMDRCIYIHISDQHPDTLRFVHDCEPFLGMDVEVITNRKYSSVDDLQKRRRFINGPGGAPCTSVLKKEVREEWVRENCDGPVTFVMGYDIDERKRADRIQETMVEYDFRFPLIEYQLTKADCHAFVANLGLERPEMYDLGYNNNNCIGCVKGGMGYWNKIREDFPEVFEMRARRERDIGRSCIRGTFLDELDPDRGWTPKEIEIEPCGLFCAIANGDSEMEEKE